MTQQVGVDLEFPENSVLLPTKSTLTYVGLFTSCRIFASLPKYAKTRRDDKVYATTL
jgi:hypothetical protein